ncbi:MAG: alpha-amylase family glycosyl hydrolase [Patescibacteria group bacterium]
MEGMQPWWMSAKIYELYIDKFAGDLRGLTLRLDYFTALGINTLHLLPHYPSPMVDDGYDITDYRSVRPQLGTLDDFKILLVEAHARGIKIIIDFVLNHTSREHPWFLEARQDSTSAKRGYYLWSTTATEFAKADNPFPDMKPHNWIYNSDTDDYYFATYYPGQPDLNWDNAEVFDAMLGHMEFWAALGVDGFRLDAVPHLVKREGTTCVGLPETHRVIKRIRARLEKNYPTVVLLAEAHQTPALTKTYFGKGDECHLAYHFPLMEQLWLNILLRKGDIAQMIQDTYNIPKNCQWVTFLRNHDEISLRTLPAVESDQLVRALDPEKRYLFRKGQTTCVRVATALGGDESKILAALRLLYEQPGVPVMYYGDELGMPNSSLTGDRFDTRRYVRGTFDWAHTDKQMADPDSLWHRVSLVIKSSHPIAHTAAHEGPGGKNNTTHLPAVRTPRAGRRRAPLDGKGAHVQPRVKRAPRSRRPL